MNINKFKMLVQREVWEHKAPLIWTPAIISALFIFLTLFAVVMAADHFNEIQQQGIGISIDDGRVSVDELVKSLQEEVSSEKRQKVLAVWLAIIKTPFDILLLFLLPFYCVASLFDERKDRSIYFWRSLPVSDTESLSAKLFTAILIYPAMMLLGAIAVQLVTLIVASFIAMYIGLPIWSLIWEPSHYFSFVVNGYLDYVLMMLWSLPFIATLLLAASATRRPYVWAILPWPLLMIVEKWIFGTHRFAAWVGERVQGSFAILYNDMARAGDDHGLHFNNLGESFGDMSGVLSHSQFWFGIVIGVALLAATLQIRRRVQDV